MPNWGQRVPIKPTLPTPEERLLRARLVLEEAFEFAVACGVNVFIKSSNESDDPPLDYSDLALVLPELDARRSLDIMDEMTDALADLSVVTIGSFIAMGVFDKPILEEVDANNRLKIHPDMGGSKNPITGKWEKNPDHPAPNFKSILVDMGWKE